MNVKQIKAKIDTGARTSALHAFSIQEFKHHGRNMVRFAVHPLQHESHKTIWVEAPLYEKRMVRDSGGKQTYRPVIMTRLMVGDIELAAEITLVNRDQMGFRMLIGRQALRKNLLVDPARSYLVGKKLKTKLKKKSKTKGN